MENLLGLFAHLSFLKLLSCNQQLGWVDNGRREKDEMWIRQSSDEFVIDGQTDVQDVDVAQVVVVCVSHIIGQWEGVF